MAEIKNTPISKPVVEDAVAETVAEVVEDKVIVTPEPKKDVPTLGFNEDGVMGSTTTNAEKAKVEKIEVVESTTTKVALFSTRNVYADGFGKINVGYNIVPKKYVDFWTAQKGIRLCTPEEVAEAFA
jgi:UTP-glucose-1-phosphate uridylyltransferase